MGSVSEHQGLAQLVTVVGSDSFLNLSVPSIFSENDQFSQKMKMQEIFLAVARWFG